MSIHAPEDAATLPLLRTDPSSCILDDTLSLPRFGERAGRRDEVVGGYRIVREVGVGGMGVVYEALDLRLKRRAAIKMIRGGTVRAEAVRRFQTEAEAIAQAHHPNIVQIYDVGFHDGQPYVALEYLAGGSLYARAANKPQPPAEAAALIRTLADAMQKAHAGGVIHRDLKPANVMFTEDGVPKITDFGAARLTQDATDDGPLTQVGEVIGTPQYMAPEQARGTVGAITPAVDVYALGAVLYHLLTGRPPHDGPDPFEVMHAAVHVDPVRPRQLVPAIPRDLETICLKALEKQAGNRYASAGEMAADLGRYLAGESILAKPDGTVVRLWKKAKRKPAVAGLAVGIVLVALVGLAAVAWQYRVAWHNADVARANALDANTQRETAEKALAKATEEEGNTRRESAVKEQALYQSRVSEIALMLDGGDNRKAHQLLTTSGTIAPGQPDLRHWEWHHLNRQGTNFLWNAELSTGDEVTGIWGHEFALSPDGRTLLVSGGDAYARNRFDYLVPAQWFFHDAATGERRQVMANALPQSAVQLVWRDAETIVAATPEKGTRVVHYPSGRVVHSWAASKDAVHSAYVSPCGGFAWHCTRFDVVTLFDTRTGKEVRSWTLPGTVITALNTAQGRDHWRIVVGTDDGTHVIDPEADGFFTIPGQYPHRAAVSADGQTIALHHSPRDNQPGFLSAWSLKDRAKLWQVDRPRITERTKLEFSPDGTKLCELFNANTHVKLRDARTGHTLWELRGHTNRVLDCRFSPDGRHVATASNDGSVRLWCLLTHTEVARFRNHSTGARALAFDPNGWRLYSAGMDSRAIAWDLTRERTDGSRMPRFAAHGPTDGGSQAGGVWAGPDNLARFLDTTAGRMIVFDPATYTLNRVVTFEDLTGRWEKNGTDYAMDPAAKFLFGRGPRDKPVLWDAATGAVLRRWPDFPGNLNGAAISDDGTLVAANYVHRDSETKKFTRGFMVARTATGEVVHHRTLDGYAYTGLAFDRTRPLLYCGIASLGSPVAGVHRLNLDSGVIDEFPIPGPTTIRHLVVSPDNAMVAGITFDGSDKGPMVFALRTDDLTKGWNSVALGPATGLAWSPDSRRLACARYDDCLVVFDSATGREAFSKFVPSNRDGDYAFPARVAFTPDNRSLVMNHADGCVSVWRTDDWNANPATRAAARRSEAEAAAWSFHLRAAIACRDDKNAAGWTLHERWLDRREAPNAWLRTEWHAIRNPLGP